MTVFKPSYKRNENNAWEGVVKDSSGAVVAECGHDHECRDYNHSRFYGFAGAAMYCAKRMAWEMNGRPGPVVPVECKGVAKRLAS